MLKVLFRDMVYNIKEITQTLELLNELVARGKMSAKDLTLLYDTIRITEHFGLQKKIKEMLPSFPDVEEGTISTRFTLHRQRLMKLGKTLTTANVKEIDAIYNMPRKMYTDSWSMITDLENRLHIREENMEDFIYALKLLELPWALSALEGSALQDEVPLEVQARGQEAYDAFIKALKEGSKPIYQTRVMLVGPQRVGKTSLVKALTGQEFNKFEGITDGIDASRSCTLSVEHITDWKIQLDTPEGKLRKAKDKFLRAVAESMQQMKYGIQSEFEEISSGELPKLPDAIEQLPDVKTGPEEFPSTSYEEVSTQMKNILQEDVPEEDILRVLEMLQENKNLGQNKGLEEAVDELTLSIWDFAGQNVYYITHQVFLVPRAIYILCFNLCDDLNAPAEGGEKGLFCEHHMTNLEVIIFWLRSIYSNTTENQPAPGQMQLSPSVFIAGTHRDSLRGNAEEKQALAEKQFAVIRKALKGKPYQAHVVSKCYAIDNSLRSPMDPSIVELRDHITEVAKHENYLKEEFPIKWLQFWHEIELLRINKTRLLNFKEVKDLAEKCGIIEKELLFASLHLYHDLGDIFYYGELDTPDSALNDIIILDPQWLICIFSSVFTVNVSSNQYSQYQSSWERLDDHGILEEKLIKHMWREFLDHFEYLLELMEKFDLLCLKTQSDEMPADIVRSPEEGNRLFYVPSLLKNQGVVYENQPVASKSMVIFYVDFDGFLPEGIFYRLVVRLVQWSQKKKGYEPMLFYQQAILYVDENHEMILRILPEKRSCIEVTIRTIKRAVVESDGDEDDEEDDVELDPATCKEVWRLLDMHLQSLGHTWMKRISYDFYIPCKVCKENTDLHELKKCLTADKYVACGVKRNKMKIKRIKYLFGECSSKLGSDGSVSSSPQQPAGVTDIPCASSTIDKMLVRHPSLAMDTHHTKGATPHPSSATDLTAKIVDSAGGDLQIEKIKLHIPAGAIAEGERVNVSLGQLTTDECEVPLANVLESRVSPVVSCGPSGTVFNEYCTLSFPHNAINLEAWEFTVFVKKNFLDNWKRIQCDDQNTTVSIQDGRCYIKTKHFCFYALKGKVKQILKCRKKLNLGLYGKMHGQGIYRLRVRIFSEHKYKLVKQEEESQNEKSLDILREIVVKYKNLDINIDVLHDGWKVDDHTQKMLKDYEIWSLRASTEFDLKSNDTSVKILRARISLTQGSYEVKDVIVLTDVNFSTDIPRESLAIDKMVVHHPSLATDTHHIEEATPHPSLATGTQSSSTTDAFHPSSVMDKHPSSAMHRPKHTVSDNQTQGSFDIQAVPKNDYNDLLNVVSDWWKSHGGCTGIHMMKILLRQFKEKIGEKELQDTDDVRALFKLMKAIGVASSSNHEVILEVVKVCSLDGVETEIRKIKPTFENFNLKGVKIKTFSLFRQNLIKFGKSLLTNDIVTIGHLYEIPEDKHKCPWLLICALEDKQIIKENSAEELIERLKRNKMDHYAAILESPL